MIPCVPSSANTYQWGGGGLTIFKNVYEYHSFNDMYPICMLTTYNIS